MAFPINPDRILNKTGYVIAIDPLNVELFGRHGSLEETRQWMAQPEWKISSLLMDGMDEFDYILMSTLGNMVGGYKLHPPAEMLFTCPVDITGLILAYDTEKRVDLPQNIPATVLTGAPEFFYGTCFLCREAWNTDGLVDFALLTESEANQLLEWLLSYQKNEMHRMRLSLLIKAAPPTYREVPIPSDLKLGEVYKIPDDFFE